MNMFLEKHPGVLEQLRSYKNWYLVLGCLLVGLGILSIIFSTVSTLFSILYLGGFLVVIGVIEAVQSFAVRKWGSFFLHLGLSVVYFFGGVFILMHPLINAVALTLFLAFFFMVTGGLRIFFALAKPLPHKGWIIVGGVLNILLGVLIYAQWPLSGLWVIGLLVGVDTFFTGWTLITLAMMTTRALQLNKN